MGLADLDERIRCEADTDLRTWLRRGAASAPRADLATRLKLDLSLARVEGSIHANVAAGIRCHAGLRESDFPQEVA
jgi:hypothetical protein